MPDIIYFQLGIRQTFSVCKYYKISVKNLSYVWDFSTFFSEQKTNDIFGILTINTNWPYRYLIFVVLFLNQLFMIYTCMDYTGETLLNLKKS